MLPNAVLRVVYLSAAGPHVHPHCIMLMTRLETTNSVMPALKRTRLTASAWRKANWCINCVLMRVMERRERDNS